MIFDGRTGSTRCFRATPRIGYPFFRTRSLTHHRSAVTFFFFIPSCAQRSRERGGRSGEEERWLVIGRPFLARSTSRRDFDISRLEAAAQQRLFCTVSSFVSPPRSRPRRRRRLARPATTRPADNQRGLDDLTGQVGGVRAGLDLQGVVRYTTTSFVGAVGNIAGYRYARNNKSEERHACPGERRASPGINPARVARLMVKRARLMHRHSPTRARNHPPRYYVLPRNERNRWRVSVAASESLPGGRVRAREMRIIFQASSSRPRADMTARIDGHLLFVDIFNRRLAY